MKMNVVSSIAFATLLTQYELRCSLNLICLPLIAYILKTCYLVQSQADEPEWPNIGPVA